MIAPGGGGWGRLRGLLTRDAWDQRTAVLVVAGLDPVTEWMDSGAPLAWLHGGLPPEWQGLAPEQVQRRAERAVGAADTRMYGMPSAMPPIHWLFEALRRKQVQPHWAASPYVHPGIIPPWLPEARKQPNLELLVPPDLYPQAHRARGRHAGQPAEAQRRIVRRMWDAGTLDGEGNYPDKAAFIRAVLDALDKGAPDAEANTGTIRNMVDEWERELFCPYGVIEPNGAPRFRCYGPHAIIGSVKKAARSK